MNNDKVNIILNTTIQIVNEYNFTGTTISRISKKAGISPGVIYHYFESKDEIIYKIYEDIAKRLAENIDEQELSNMSIIRQLEILICTAYRFAVNNSVEMIFVENFRNSAYMKNAKDIARKKVTERLGAPIDAAVSRGEILDLPHNTIYTLMIGTATQLAKLEIIGQNPLGKYTIEQVAHQIVKTILVG